MVLPRRTQRPSREDMGADNALETQRRKMGGQNAERAEEHEQLFKQCDRALALTRPAEQPGRVDGGTLAELC